MLRSRVQTETEENISWRDRLELAVLQVPLKVTARLCQPTVSVKKLIHLQEGDIFPIQVGDGVEVRVEDAPIFRGELACHWPPRYGASCTYESPHTQITFHKITDGTA